MEKTVEKLLVLELSKGSVKAFNELYKEYCDRLFSFSVFLLKDRDDAEEVVQHVFLKVWEKRFTLNPELSFQAYLFKITKNYVFKLFNDAFKDKRRFDSHITNSDNGLDNASSDMINSELKESVRKEIANLPLQRKTVFILSRKLNLTNREIAKKLNISVNTVKRHMNLALKSLNQVLINQ